MVKTDRRLGARPGQAEEDHPHRDAHARQRHRHQLLRGQRRRATPTCKHRPVGLGIMGFQDCLHLTRTPYASAGGGGVRRPLDGSGLLPRLLGLDRARRGARPLLVATRARCGTAASCRRTRSNCCARSAAATSRSTSSSTLDWDALRARIKRARHAQLQLRRHRADRDHLQHHRRRRPRSSPSTRTSTSSRTCRASSRSSTSTWCAT